MRAEFYTVKSSSPKSFTLKNSTSTRTLKSFKEKWFISKVQDAIDTN